VIPLVIFWAIAAWTSTEPLEADLAQRSTAALKDTVLDKRRIAVAGRDVTFAAEAFSEDGRLSAVASVEAVPGVRMVNDETRLVPEAKPFVWSAERDVVRVTLGGSSPLPSSKSKLMEAARAALGGVEVADRMNLARGAPQRFDNAALLLLDQIAKLKDGKITLSDNKVTLAGMARELGGREAIAAALKNLPEGYSVAANDVKAPPYIFQAYKDPVAVTLTLTGYVPDNNVHAALVQAAGMTVTVPVHLNSSLRGGSRYNLASLVRLFLSRSSYYRLSKVVTWAAGAALAAKRGRRSKSSLKGASKQMEKSMSEKQLKDFAKTKRKKLPPKKR